MQLDPYHCTLTAPWRNRSTQLESHQQSIVQLQQQQHEHGLDYKACQKLPAILLLEQVVRSIHIDIVIYT